jgi:hypothetical protein
MPLPAKFSSTGTTLAQTGDHPAGTFLFQGSKTDVAGTSAAPTLRNTCVNVYGKKHEGNLVYCIETVVSSGGTVTRIHSWKTAQQYGSSHLQMWRFYDMEPNRDFDTGNGLRSEGGEHLDGGNELCERDGRMKTANIEAKCT